MKNTEIDQILAVLAKRQHGAFSHAQVVANGGTDHVISARLAAQSWIHLSPGVYALTSAPSDFLRQCWASVLGEPDASIGVRAGAAVHRFTAFRACRPEIVVPLGSNARSRLATVHRFDGALVTTVAGLKVTTRAQTMFDIAPRVTFERLETALDSQILDKGLTLDALEERLDFYKGTRRVGVPVMRGLIEERRADGWVPVESELERMADRILVRLAGRPTVIRQATFPWLDRGKGRVDRYLPVERIVIEIDGRRWHTRVKDFDRDRWRDNQIAAHGLIPLRFTYLHVKSRPREVLAVIEQTRRARRNAA